MLSCSIIGVQDLFLYRLKAWLFNLHFGWGFILFFLYSLYVSLSVLSFSCSWSSAFLLQIITSVFARLSGHLALFYRQGIRPLMQPWIKWDKWKTKREAMQQDWVERFPSLGWWSTILWPSTQCGTIMHYLKWDLPCTGACCGWVHGVHLNCTLLCYYVSLLPLKKTCEIRQEIRKL